jgi:Kyakuja-Dileera-Zisupton transposase
VNSDYGVSGAFRGMQGLQEIVFSYDIACQYSRRFFARFRASPSLSAPDCALVFAIPKFHLPAHKEDCRYFYSFNYLKNVGRTDGEAIERFWSRHNFLSGSTMRMAPEARLDTLDSHFADWNWQKALRMGTHEPFIDELLTIA